MKTPRIQRTKIGHYELYVSHMEKHDQIRTGVGDPSQLTKLWTQLKDELNGLGCGRVKTLTEWQTTFRLWKNSIRCKARAIMVHGSGTGGGPASTKVLTELEERALSLWGREVVDGVANVTLLGREEGDGTHTIAASPKPVASSSSTSRSPVILPPNRQSAHRNKTTCPNLQQSLSDGDHLIAEAIRALADNVGKLVDQQTATNKMLELILIVLQRPQ